MKTKKYETKGTFEKKGKKQKFSKIVEAANEKMAKEKTLSEIGGKQRIRRANIKITETKEMKSSGKEGKNG